MSPQVTLVPIPVPVLRMLATGDLVAAGRATDLTIPPYVLDLQWVWHTFPQRAEAHPEAATWFTPYFAVEDGRIVGHALTPRPPSENGEVLIGYGVDPIERRRGVATAAAAALLDLVAQHPEVQLVAAQVDPANAASLGVCRRLGFTDVGEELHSHSGTLMRRLELPMAPR